jgi:glycosyltransferase involved in cell wall biosynthesis
MRFCSAMSPPPEILHFIGCDNDHGGIISVIRNLASTGRFRCVLGCNPGCVQERESPLSTVELPRTTAEKINLRGVWTARKIARAVQIWLRASPGRIFHGHSRAGLLVALWLNHFGENRFVVSVHCYGRRRWFYRWAAQRLGDRLYWLSPAMKTYYGLKDATWTQCIPGCVVSSKSEVRERLRENDLIRLGGIGALVRWKNWHLLLDALLRLSPEIRGRFRFSHIGTDDGSADARVYEEELRAKSKAAGLLGIVEWRGQQSSAAAFLQETDCLVILSHNEPFSMAMLEALQAGVPVLAADSGGARDVVTAVNGGWLFRENDAQHLADRLQALVNDQVLEKTEIDRNGLKRFQADDVGEQWLEVYRKLSS